MPRTFPAMHRTATPITAAMKIRVLLLLLSSLALGAAPSRAAIVYSGIQNIAVPLDLNGVYVNPFTKATAATQPADWNTAPWINPFFGGVDIANDDLLRPAVTGATQILKLTFGTVVNGGSTFTAARSGSAAHVGAGVQQFQLGTTGYLGFVMQTAVAGPLFYGWMQVVIQNAGPGTIVDWAYQDSAGTLITVGAIPEPATALLTLAGSALLALGRRRRCAKIS